jgi:ABC-type glucose/galactose transport system permease subunit
MSHVALKDTLSKSIPYKLENLRKIPFSDGADFYLNADIIEAGGGRLKVPVFMVTAPNKYILKGLNTKYFDANAGYKMGSLYETTTEFAYSRDPVDYE